MKLCPDDSFPADTIKTMIIFIQLFFGGGGYTFHRVFFYVFIIKKILEIFLITWNYEFIPR